jgi:hypothetical protein
MRLIDADAFIGSLEEYINKPITAGLVATLVELQPTAYDVEKVVEELEEEREYSYADFEEYVKEKSPCLDAEYDDYFHRGLERAVVIVKRGGRE